MIATTIKDGRTLRLIDRRTNDLIVTETRAPAEWRALPRKVQNRVLDLEASRKFLVRYQDFVGPYVSTVRCWKCGNVIITWQPALRPIAGAKTANNGELTIVRVNGQDMVLAALLPFNHYRSGLFEYRTRRNQLAAFSYLHCADCVIQSADGEDLLACLLGQFDLHRDLDRRHGLAVASDDDWAQSMFQWSDIELAGLAGPSVGPGQGK